MGRIYNIVSSNQTMTSGINVLQAIMPVANPPAAGSVLAIRRVEISQHASTSSAQVRAALSFRTGGNLTVATVTPVPRTYGGAASAITGIAGTLAAGRCGISATADATPTYVDYVSAAFNTLNGWLWIPVPEELLLVTGSVAFVVRFLADPPSLVGWNCTMTFEEIY